MSDLDSYKVILTDNIEIFLKRDAIECSPTLTKLFKESDGSFKSSIMLSDVNSETFTYIQSYLNYITICPENSGCYIEQTINNKNEDELIEVIYLANFLELQQLVEIAGIKFKSIIL